jgi:hypothetical protein
MESDNSQMSNTTTDNNTIINTDTNTTINNTNTETNTNTNTITNSKMNSHKSHHNRFQVPLVPSNAIRTQQKTRQQAIDMINERVNLSLSVTPETKEYINQLSSRMNDIVFFHFMPLDQFISHPSNASILKRVIGRDGAYLVKTTNAQDLYFVWHNRTKHTFEFWGPSKNSIFRGVNRIFERIMSQTQQEMYRRMTCMNPTFMNPMAFPPVNMRPPPQFVNNIMPPHGMVRAPFAPFPSNMNMPQQSPIVSEPPSLNFQPSLNMTSISEKSEFGHSYMPSQ